MRSSDKNDGRTKPETTSGGSEPDRQAALSQLAKILESPQFRSSKRCSLFLRYVVEHANDGHPEDLKERTLGIEVFERAPQYDTNQDPIVRAVAGEVRKRLAQYYLEPGREDELRISLPTGSYQPEIHSHASKPAVVVEAESIRPVRPGFRKALIAVAAASLAAIALALYFTRSPRPTDLDRFWAPVLEPGDTVLVCLGQPRTYNFSSRTQFELEKWIDNGSEKQHPPPGLSSVPLEDLIPMWDRYVALDDAQAFSQIANLFAARGRRAQLYGVRSVSLEDLRRRPCVLIGAFNNEWTMSLAGELRYHFDSDFENRTETISDRQNPGKSEWTLVNSWPHRKIQVDYAIVSRVLNPTTEQTVVIAAGITHYGTHAAGEFLTNQGYFAEALNGAPADWERKNMQVILSTKVMSGTHGPPKVQAVHFW